MTIDGWGYAGARWLQYGHCFPFFMLTVGETYKIKQKSKFPIIFSPHGVCDPWVEWTGLLEVEKAGLDGLV